jgi:hypothetical protein
MGSKTKAHIINNISISAPIQNYYGYVETIFEGKGNEHQPKEKNASKEMMSHAALATLQGGYWKSQRSWSVVFMVYCIWGFKGRVNEFLSEVQAWPDRVADRMLCNRDAVEKLKNMYNFTNDVGEWRANGVPEPYCILGEQLENELNKLVFDG